MDLEWIPPLKDGGSKILGYLVEYKEEGTETWVKVIGCHSCADRPVLESKLKNFLFVFFRPRKLRSVARVL